MPISEENIRLLFGIKLKQLRTEKGLSLAELSGKTGISISYLNEIEKGKKYPKREKISVLAEHLGTSYDHLVSLQLEPKMAPIADLLNSNFLDELPLDMFGIDPASLVDLLSSAPSKLSAFVNTLLEMGRNYDMRVETFYFSVLRSYQEIHYNYFEELEEAATQFSQEYNISEAFIQTEALERLLTEKFHYQIDRNRLSRISELRAIRSFYDPRLHILYINGGLNNKQLAFLYGRELAFKYLNLSPRTYTASPLEIKSFDEVLNNFKASYFSSALLIPRHMLAKRLSEFFKAKTVSSSALIRLMEHFNATEEMLLQRLTNILPKHFGLKDLFFLKFNHDKEKDSFSLIKEIHLSGLHNPHALATNEHYCRRWISLSIIHDLEKMQEQGDFKGPISGFQRSKYYGTDSEYLIFTMARSMFPTPNITNSVSIGLLLNETTKRKIRFWNDESIRTRWVSETCERCPAPDCQERAAPSSILEEQNRQQKIKDAILELIWDSTD